MPFRVLWWSRAVSFAGDGIGRTALVLYAATHGVAAVSLVLLAVALPRFLGPVAGALSDRLDQRRLMAVCELGQAAVFALLAVFLPPLPVLVVFVLVSGCFATAFVPAGRSAVPALVPGTSWAGQTRCWAWRSTSSSRSARPSAGRRSSLAAPGSRSPSTP